ncbi:MAG: type II toxin-antitoxin system VapC family toxin [Candidatus Helarchaeota archaeon]
MNWFVDANALIKWHLLFKQHAFKRVETLTSIFSILEFPLAATHDGHLIVYPDHQIYDLGLELAIKLRKKGIPIPVIDLLNGLIAMNENAILITDDSHFKSLQDVQPSLKIMSINKYIEEFKKSK